MKYIFFILSASLLLNACTEDFFSQTVKIDPPEYDKQLSFHLLLDNNDSLLRLTVTRNYGILETVPANEGWYVKGATAELYENGQKLVTFSPLSADSSFVLVGLMPHPFQTGSTYEIRAAHPNYPTVRAVQVVPNDFQVDSLRIRRNAIPGEFGDRLDLLELFLQDQPSVKNYYEVTLLKKYYDYTYDPVTGTYDTTGIYEYPLPVDGYNDPNVQFGFGNSGLISDQFFDGQSYKFQARFSGNNGGPDSTVTVRVRNVTEDYFKWSRSYQANYDVDENPLVEPISVFHNLENGLGIFSIAQEKNFEL
ncbi:MAG: DUF4249 family protein [Saprospiraceae bacterium]|nr:DUF4249 family protein [Saprospiraceae bacterium]